MTTIREVAGAGADRPEGATECRQHRQILFEGGWEVKVNSITGARLLDNPNRRRPEIQPKAYQIPGLRIFHLGGDIRFEWVQGECIDEAMARDAQCRAGWDDDGHGFYGLDVGILPNGAHRATWSCGVSLD